MRQLAIINSAERGTKKFTDPICRQARIRGVTFDVLQHDETSAERMRDFSACIISGSPRGDDIVASRCESLCWLLDYSRPVLGICAGHQIMGVLNSAELIRGTQAEVDQTIELKVTRRDELFRGVGWRRVFSAFSDHVDAVTVPENYQLLARSTACLNQVMKHRTLPHFSVQFHAEFSCPWLIDRFLRIALR